MQEPQKNFPHLGNSPQNAQKRSVKRQGLEFICLSLLGALLFLFVQSGVVGIRLFQNRTQFQQNSNNIFLPLQFWKMFTCMKKQHKKAEKQIRKKEEETTILQVVAAGTTTSIERSQTWEQNGHFQCKTWNHDCYVIHVLIRDTRAFWPRVMMPCVDPGQAGSHVTSKQGIHDKASGSDPGPSFGRGEGRTHL